MLLDRILTAEVKEIFEQPDYYGRELSDFEVQQIAQNLANLGELLINIVKRKVENESEPKV